MQSTDITSKILRVLIFSQHRLIAGSPMLLDISMASGGHKIGQTHIKIKFKKFKYNHKIPN